MRKPSLLIIIILTISLFIPEYLQAQDGDQILDGIGETGLIARYTLKKDTKDWSRNNLHASMSGTGYQFIKDDLFEQVLSIPENSESYLSIPGEIVTGEESLTVTGWFFLRSGQSGQRFFDFGKDHQSHIYVAQAGTGDQEELKTIMQTPAGTVSSTADAIPRFKWVYLTLVMNAPEKSIATYLNGRKVSEMTDADFKLDKLFDPESGNKNKLLIGQSIDFDQAVLQAKLYDLRIYRIALNQGQIGRIMINALKKEGSTVRTNRRPDPDLPVFDESTAPLYYTFLTAVPDIHVETALGYLPKLPRFIKGNYQENMDGPDVRVLWPAPEDNSQVLNPGTYSIRGRVAGTNFKPRAIVTVKKDKQAVVPDRKLKTFGLDQVTLDKDIHHHDTKFIENRDKFISGLAQTNPNNFLYMFRNAFGQVQPDGAEALKGWDSQETKLRGHATGHYLSGIAQAYASTGYNPDLQANFAQKMDYMVNTLYSLSQLSGQAKTPGEEHVSAPTAVPPGPGKSDFDSDLSETGIRTDYWNWGTGYISAYPPDQFIMLENGASYGGDDTKIWAPYYTLHKILAGLMDVYEVSGNDKALEIVKGMGDWVYARLKLLPTQTLINMWNRYIAGEFGGMNEAMARLYRLTQEPRYLEVARLFDNIKVFYGDAEHSHGLAKNVDLFRGLHANQHIPQIMGALEMYRDSDNPDYFQIADNFWNIVTNDYMYSIGGVAGARNPNNAECFTSQPATLYENGFSAGGQNETCATYNMLKLTRNLFLFDQRAELMDYYERGLYNHILASVAENSPANTYHVPLRAGSVKHFGNAHMDGFSCCNGTALENSTKLQNTIYFKSADNKELYVNLYVPSTLTWSERDITVTQSTAFPQEDYTQLTITGKGKFDLKVRVPHWATKGFFVTINGNEVAVHATPGSYLTLSRRWKDGDIVELRMPFDFHLESVMDQPNIASLFYGPVLLAAQETEPRKEWRKITLHVDDLGKTLSGHPEQLEFNLDGVVLKPFYESYGRYSVYFDVTLIK